MTKQIDIEELRSEKKNLIIIGPSRSGKTRLAKQITEPLLQHQYVEIGVRGHRVNSKAIAKAMSIDTKILVIDDIENTNKLKDIIEISLMPFVVKKRMSSEYVIKKDVKAVFTCDEKIDTDCHLLRMGSSFTEHFRIIDLFNK